MCCKDYPNVYAVTHKHITLRKLHPRQDGVSVL